MFNPQNPEIMELSRQRRMADLLTSQGMQTPQGQTVAGGIYVPPNPMEYLAKLYSTYQGTQANKDLDAREIALAKALRQQQTDDLVQYQNLMNPRPTLAPEQAGPMVNQQGQAMPIPREMVQGVPDRQAANLFAASSQNPALQAAGLRKLTEGPIKAGVDDVLLDPVTFKPIFEGAGKDPEKIRTAAIVLGLDNKPRKDWTAQDRAMIDAQIQKTQQSGAMNLGQKGFDNTLKLRGDFRSEPVYKGFQEIESAYSQINAGLNSKSPAGDLAAATKFMKLLDPTSVVRESELSMAMKATGALDRLYNYANLVATGQKLTPTQREDFRKLGNEFYTTSYNQYNTKRKEYSDIAERNQLNVDDVVGKMPKPPTVSQPPMFATNPTTGERIQSTDGGNNWKPAPKGK
jgi:hypothetical protein